MSPLIGRHDGPLWSARGDGARRRADGGGLLLAPLTTQPWHLYVTWACWSAPAASASAIPASRCSCRTGSSAAAGSPWGIAFAGVGIGSVTLLPWVQHMIERTGWRTACTAMGMLVLVVLAPINLLLRKRPEDIGLLPDGDAAPPATSAQAAFERGRSGLGWHRLDAARAMRTARFWWIALGYFCGLYIWYAVQVHQTKFLLDIGFSAECCGVGARRRQPARHSRPDLARASLRPDRARMDLGDRAAPALRSASPR